RQARGGGGAGDDERGHPSAPPGGGGGGWIRDGVWRVRGPGVYRGGGRPAEPLKLKLHQFGVREPAEFEAAFAEMAAKADVAVSEASRQRQGTAQSRSGGPR